MKSMVVRCIDDTLVLPDMYDEGYEGPRPTRYSPGSGITLGREYAVVAVKLDGTWHQIIDDTDEEYAYPASRFEIVSK